MFDDLKLELGRNFKVPHALGVLIHLKIPKSKIPINVSEFHFKNAKFRCVVI
jgi:hypothetical protein